jgi:uncharacterized Fe-S cluster protein YjdI
MKIESKEFSNKELTVNYDPCLCTLSGKCAKELSDVFSNRVIPWINLEHTETEKIINQIKKCPSGALKFHLNKKELA